MFNEECLMFTATTFIHFIFLYPLHHLHPCIVTRFIVFILHCAEIEEILNGKLYFLCSARFPYDTHLQVAALCTHVRSVFLLHYFWFHQRSTVFEQTDDHLFVLHKFFLFSVTTQWNSLIGCSESSSNVTI